MKKHQILERTLNSQEQDKRSDKILEYLNSIIASNPEQLSGYSDKACFLQQANDISTAITVYDEYLQRYPNDYKALREKTDLLASAQELQEILELWDGYIRDNPKLRNGYRQKLNVLKSCNNFKTALKVCAEYIRQNPNDMWGYARQLSLAEESGDTAAANEAYEQFAIAAIAPEVTTVKNDLFDF